MTTRKTTSSGDKLFIVRKYIKARSAAEAIRKEKTHAVDDVWVDDAFKQGAAQGITHAVGFAYPRKEE